MPRLEDDLAASFRQGVHLAQRDPSVSSEALLFGGSSGPGGVCFPLAALWVTRHMWYRGEGPAGRAAYLACDNSLRAALATHRDASMGARFTLPPATPWQDYRQRILNASGLAWIPLPLGEFRTAGRAFDRQAAGILASLTSSHSYHFLCLHGDAPAKGHAMASYTANTASPDRPLLHLFDPNWGEFKVSARHAPQFLARLLAWYDGHREFGPMTQLSLGRLRPRS